MEAYSMDLRERVAAACDSGTLSQPEIAEQYEVSVSFITRLLRRRRQTGSVAPKPHAGGPAPVLSERDRERVAARVRGQPDITLAELCARVSDRVSDSTMSRLLIGMGLTRKKRRFTPTSETVRVSSGFARSTGNVREPSRRGASYSSTKAGPPPP
jgi:transposase